MSWPVKIYQTKDSYITMNIDGLKQMFSTLNSKELSELLVIIAQEIEKRMSK